MTDFDQNELAGLIGLYLDGMATSEEMARLSALIAGNAEAARIMARACRLDSAMAEYFSEQDAEVSEWLRAQIPQPAGDISGAKLVERRSFPWISLAVAASVAVAVGGLWWFVQGRQAPALRLRVAEVAGTATIENGRLKIEDRQSGKASDGGASGVRSPEIAQGVSVVVGQELHLGDRVVVSQGGKVGLKYDGEATTIDLHSAVAVFGVEQGAKRVRLDSGLLLCTVAPQVKPFRLETPHGVATVVGTRFALDTGNQETLVAVQEGTVVVAQGTKRQAVKAGDAAVAGANELRMVAVEDAWIRELIVRSEMGPWDAADFGKGAFAQRGWCMDARGSSAERLLWNLRGSPNVELLQFDTARWSRAVVICEVMLLGTEAVPPGSPIEGEKPNPQMSVSASVGGAGPAPDVLALSAFVYGGEQPGLFGETISLTRGNPISYDVWHKMVLYFDLNAEGGPMILSSFWREADRVPVASQWSSAVLPKFERGGKAGFGWLVGPNYRVLVKGMKLVPLGGEMAQPPAGLRGAR